MKTYACILMTRILVTNMDCHVITSVPILTYKVTLELKRKLMLVGISFVYNSRIIFYSDRLTRHNSNTKRPHGLHINASQCPILRHSSSHIIVATQDFTDDRLSCNQRFPATL